MAAAPVLPGYADLREVGRGGFAAVYEARQVGLGRAVAVKILHGAGVVSPTALQRFRLEAAALARFDHPNVVAVFDAGECAGVPYLVMEYHAAGSLARRLAAGPLEPRTAAELAEGVARGVAYCHAHGIVHRDLKPGNILLAVNGVPKVTDFGLAKWLDASDGPSRSHDVLGTPCYMAPEQAAGTRTPHGPTIDVYGVGAVLYCMLTGRPPFVAPTVPLTLALVQLADPLPPARLTAGVPRGLEAICLKALSRSPGRRYPTAESLADDLRRWLDGRPIVARPPGVVERCAKWVRRHPSRAATGALAATLALGVVATDEVLRRRQREVRAAAQVQALATAETAAAPRLIEALASDGGLARPGLRQLAEEPVSTKPGLHARMALLAEEPERADELAAYLPACSPDELIPLREALRPWAARVTPSLWVVASDPATPAGGRVRVAAALAGLAPDDPRWAAVAAPLVAGLVRENSLDAATWGLALSPARGRLLPALTATYADTLARVESGRLAPIDLAREVTVLETAAGLIARYAGDRPDLLAELVVVLDPRHYRLIEAAVRTHIAAVIPRLRAEVARTAESDRDDVIDARARRRAHAAAALIALQDGAAWDQLRHSPDQGVRSYLIPRLAEIGVDPRRVIGRFRAESDASARRALVLALGDYEPGPEWGMEREAFARDLLDLYRTDPDAGLHAAVEWLLRVRWGKGAAVAEADAALAAAPPAGPPRGWFVTASRMTLVFVTGPVEFRMGSPTTEPGWSDEELAHDKRIDRSFAIGAKEVTAGQYQAFLRDRGVPFEPSRNGPDLPVGVTWYDAASYCNWLSEREGLEPCYVKNERGKYAEGMSIAPGHLGRSGYRLPTDAEWEYACRAGSATARYYGRGPALLQRYGWHLVNAGDTPRPVGTLRPNDFGLFDTLGNVWEWCEEPHHHEPEKFREDAGQGQEPLADLIERRIKGGAFNVVPLRLRAALRNHARPTQNTLSIGFRVIRTLP